MVRPKYRYVAIKLIPIGKRKSDFAVKNADLYKAIIDEVKAIHGDFGLACTKTGFTCKYCNEMTNVAICKVRHGPHRFVTSVLPLINSIGKHNVQVDTIHISATIRQAYTYLLKYQKRELEKAYKLKRSHYEIRDISDKFLNLNAVKKLITTERNII